MSSNAYDRFMASTRIDYEKWHDGEPYDPAALDEMSQEQINSVIRWVLDRPRHDWRDLEVLSHIGSSVTLYKLAQFLDHDNRELRLTAMELLLDHDRLPDAEQRVLAEIAQMEDLDGVVRLDSLIDRLKTPAIEQALLEAMRKGTDYSIHAAAKLMERRGVIDSEWDWTYRPLWLALRHGKTPAERQEAFDQIRTLVKM